MHSREKNIDKDDVILTLTNTISKLNQKERTVSKQLLFRIVITFGFFLVLLTILLRQFPLFKATASSPTLRIDTVSQMRDRLHKDQIILDSVTKVLDSLENKYDSLIVERSFKYEGFISGNVIYLKPGESVFKLISANSKNKAKTKAYQLFKEIDISIIQIQPDGSVQFLIDDKIARKQYNFILNEKKKLFTRIEVNHGISIYLVNANPVSGSVMCVPRIKSNI